MKWIHDEHKITDEMIEKVSRMLNVDFPVDFLSVIKKYDAGYPCPDSVTVDGNDESVNNLVSFMEGDSSFILDIIEETENFKESNLIPIAEDSFGNLFCYDFSEENSKIVFWDHEINNSKKFVCNSFTELLQMLHDEED